MVKRIGFGIRPTFVLIPAQFFLSCVPLANLFYLLYPHFPYLKEKLQYVSQYGLNEIINLKLFEHNVHAIVGAQDSN